MRHNITTITIVLAIVAIMATACRPDVRYSESHAVDEHGWLMTDTLNYDIAIDDTITPLNLFFDLRICRSYPYSNAFFFVQTTFPDGSVALDTLECPLTLPDGTWRGKEGSRYVDNRFFFMRHVVFPMSGTYRIGITHGMREKAIEGISDIGLVLKNTNRDE